MKSDIHGHLTAPESLYAYKAGLISRRAGDLLVGDADGVVAVARHLEERVFDICEVIAQRGEAIMNDIPSGTSLAAARARHGYPVLQRMKADQGSAVSTAWLRR